MTDFAVDVDTSPDGTLVIAPRGALGPDDTAGLCHTLVHAVRHLRPRQLVLDLHEVADLDPINLGALAAACHLGDDQHVPVFVDHSTAAIAHRLTAAGVPRQRLRHTGPSGTTLLEDAGRDRWR